MLYVFDIGNVIIDIDFNRVLKIWSSFSGVPLETLSEKFSLGEAFEQHECGKITDAEFAKMICDEIDISINLEQFFEGWNAIFVEIKKDVIDLINKLRDQGHRVVLLSNTNNSHFKYWSINYPEIAKSADFIYLSQELGMRKPNLDIFEYLIDTEGTPASKIIFFDDVLENVNAAKKVGINSIHAIDKNVVFDFFKDKNHMSLP